jgi:hypothetical protein
MEIIRMSDYDHSVRSDWSAGLKFYQYSAHNQHVLSAEEQRCLSALYATIYSGRARMDTSPSVHKLTQVKFCGELIGSSNSRSWRSSKIQAYWPDGDGRIELDVDCTSKPWPGRIKYFLLHNLEMNGSLHWHLLASVEWYQCANLTSTERESFGTAVDVWRDGIFVQNGAASFIPVQRLKCKFVERSFKICARRCVCVVSRNRFGS